MNMKTAALPQELATRSDEVRSTVAHNLDAALKSQRWSRRAAATALGLTHTYVNSRAAGDTDLSASDLAMFADFLSLPVSHFFEPIPNEPENVTDMGSKRRTLVPMVGGSGRTLQDHASVAQGIEHWFPVPGVARSNRVGGTVIPFPTPQRATIERAVLAPVTPIGGAA